MNSTQSRTHADMIGRCAGRKALTALRLNELTALLLYCLTGSRAAPRSRCFPCLASLDPGGIWPAARLLCPESTCPGRPHSLLRAELSRYPEIPEFKAYRVRSSSGHSPTRSVETRVPERESRHLQDRHFPHIHCRPAKVQQASRFHSPSQPGSRDRPRRSRPGFSRRDPTGSVVPFDANAREPLRRTYGALLFLVQSHEQISNVTFSATIVTTSNGFRSTLIFDERRTLLE